jgi:hypothetical protein
MAFTITPSKRWWSFNAPVRPRSLGSLGAEGMMEGFESEGFGKGRDADVPGGTYSRDRTPYLPHGTVHDSSLPGYQQPPKLYVQPGKSFAGFGDIIGTVKTFFTAHPLLTIAGLIAGIGFSSGAFKEFLKENPFDGDDEDLFSEEDS